MGNKFIYLKDHARTNDHYEVDRTGRFVRLDSKLEFFNDATGERIWEPLHNKTVLAGSAFVLYKLFNLDKSFLSFTPTYDKALGLINASPDSDALTNESERAICGFCVGQGGAGTDIADVFTVKYASWITPDNIIPFRYPLQNVDDVDENIYKGKRPLTLADGRQVNAYYFKTFSNTPILSQNYVSSVGMTADTISAETVYQSNMTDSEVRSFVELHLKVTSEDCREFFISHAGLESAKINQISLVTGWKKKVSVNKLNSVGAMQTAEYDYLQCVRPFSVANIPNEILSDRLKSISIVYTLFA